MTRKRDQGDPDATGDPGDEGNGKNSCQGHLPSATVRKMSLPRESNSDLS